MKLALPVFLIGLLFLTACIHTKVITQLPDGTFQTNVVKQLDIERIARVSGDAAEMTTIAWLSERPDDRVHFQGVATSLSGLIDSEDFTLEAFSAALDNLPVKELKGTEAKLALAGGRIFVREAFREVATLIEGQQLIRRTMEEVRLGIFRGLAQVPETI